MNRVKLKICSLPLLLLLMVQPLLSHGAPQQRVSGMDCEMSQHTQVDGTFGDTATLCDHCSTCLSCLYSGAAVPDRSHGVAAVHGGLPFASESTSFSTLFPPVDSPPPRTA